MLVMKEVPQAENLGSERACGYCGMSIPSEASVCHHCSRGLTSWQALSANPVSLLSLLVALGMMALAYLQFVEAGREREAAAKAMDRAQKAEETAKRAAEEIKAMREASLDCSTWRELKMVNGTVTVPKAGCYKIESPPGTPSADLEKIECQKEGERWLG